MTIESPRKRFFQGPFSKAHRNFAGSDHCLAAIDAALLQYQQQLGSPADLTSASEIGLRLDGARKFAELFVALAEKEDRGTAKNTDALPFPTE